MRMQRGLWNIPIPREREVVIPEATVRSRHFRAKSLLRELLAQEIDLAERDLLEFGGTNCAGVIASVLARLNS